MCVGQRHPSGQQTADVSWWPKQSAWQGAGLDVGYWSVDDEAWYQKRLELIRMCTNGRSVCMTATEWRNALRFHKQTGRIVEANRRSAEVWISKNISGTA